MTVGAVSTLCGCFAITAAAGLDYAFGSIVVYMVSYFHESRKMRFVDYDSFFPVPMLTNVFGAIAAAIANCMVDCFYG
jgi:cell division protein FtsX